MSSFWKTQRQRQRRKRKQAGKEDKRREDVNHPRPSASLPHCVHAADFAHLKVVASVAAAQSKKARKRGAMDLSLSCEKPLGDLTKLSPNRKLFKSCFAAGRQASKLTSTQHTDILTD